MARGGTTPSPQCRFRGTCAAACGVSSRPVRCVAVAVDRAHAYRAYLDRSVMCFYKEIIFFRQQGDPRELLKCIIPREAELLDAAMAVHVRFRLGGDAVAPTYLLQDFHAWLDRRCECLCAAELPPAARTRRSSQAGGN